MTPLEHYREAEKAMSAYKVGLRDAARLGQADFLDYVDSAEPMLRMAQIHATLANAHMTAGAWGNAAIHSETITHEPFEGCCDEGKP